MTDELKQRRRALAFNAVGPAVNEAGCWLPLSARKAVADAVLDAVTDPDAGYCPHCGRGDAGPSADEYEELQQRVERFRAFIAAGREQGARGITWDVLEQLLDQPITGEITVICDTVIRHAQEEAPDA